MRKIVVILREGWMIPGMIRHVSSDESAPPLRMIFLFEFPSPPHLFVSRNGWHSVKCIHESIELSSHRRRYICDLLTLTKAY